VTTAAFDTLRAAKRLKELGFDERQAEGVADMLREAREVDLSQLATKSDLANLATRVELAELKADLIKWVVGIGFAQVATILAVLKLFPGGPP
jgi:hypothetical protein